MGVSKNRWSIMDSPLRMDDLGVPPWYRKPSYVKSSSRNLGMDQQLSQKAQMDPNDPMVCASSFQTYPPLSLFSSDRGPENTNSWDNDPGCQRSLCFAYVRPVVRPCFPMNSQWQLDVFQLGAAASGANMCVA